MNTQDLCQLVELHGKGIYGFCCSLTYNRTDADDLYQDTFLKAMELIEKINKDDNPKGFLITVAVGLWKNRNRKLLWRQKIAPLKELDDNTDSDFDYIAKDEFIPENIIISNELQGNVRSAVAALKDKLKIPLYMHYTADMSIEEISYALKIPQGTVKSRLYKARIAVKKILEVNYYEKL